MLKRARQSKCRRWWVASVVSAALVLTACSARSPRVTVTPTDAPAALLGAFTDDYGSHYRVTAERFEQLPRSAYLIAEWNAVERYFLAQNAASNPSDGGLWTRVDWLEFTDQGAYGWGFCLTAYRAPSREVARAVPAADRETARSGCNGFPFTRMQRVSDSIAATPQRR